MAIMKWVHMAWNGCIMGNPSEARYPASVIINQTYNIIL